MFKPAKCGIIGAQYIGNCKMLGLIEIFATAGTLAGFYILGHDPVAGYQVSGLANLLWIVWASFQPRKAWGIIVVNMFMLAIATAYILDAVTFLYKT